MRVVWKGAVSAAFFGAALIVTGPVAQAAPRGAAPATLAAKGGVSAIQVNYWGRRRYGYWRYRRYGYWGYRRGYRWGPRYYGYRRYGYRPYYGYRRYGYRPYGYRYRYWRRGYYGPDGRYVLYRALNVLPYILYGH